VDAVLPDAFMEVFQEAVGVVDLVTDGSEVVANPAEVIAPGDGVLQEPCGVGPTGVARRAGMMLQMPFQGIGDAPGPGEVDQAAHELGLFL
jgi:hypothetical protein